MPHHDPEHPGPPGVVPPGDDSFRTLVEAVSDYAIFLLDTEGRILTWNTGAARIKGYLPGEIIGQHFSRFYTPEDRRAGRPARGLRTAADEGRFRDEGWRVRKDGSRFWASVVITALRDPAGTLLNFAKVTRDLTERKRAEDALRESEERYHLLVEGVRDYAIFLLDTEGRVLSWNAGAERIKGYRAAEIIGQHFSRFYPQEDLVGDKPGRELRAAKAEGRVEDEGWRVRKDGSRFWANVVITALYDAAGTLRGYGKVTRDLTERKRTEEERVQILAREAAAQEQARRTEEFTALLAHELRNPLSPLLMSLHAARLNPADSATLNESLERAERQARHLTDLVNDFLEMTRLNRGQVRLRQDRVDLARLVRIAVEDQRGTLEKAGLEPAVEAPPLPVWVRGDPTRLVQALTNLLDNAVKYRGTGRRVMVRVAADPGREQAVLAVADEGIGIDPELIPRLFEPFTQAERSLARTEGGLGLGLTLVRKLVELHGGEVSAGSPGPGRGATFTVRLPLEPEPAALAPNAARPAPAAPARPLRVVVIEDNADVAESMRVFLELLGHRVTVAGSGPSGVQAADVERPDVVFSDIGLPGFDGFEVARRLRRTPGLERARLIALTGYDDADSRAHSRQAGFDVHLVKPAEPAELERLLAGTADSG